MAKPNFEAEFASIAKKPAKQQNNSAISKQRAVISNATQEYIPSGYSLDKVDCSMLVPANKDWNFFSEPTEEKLVELAKSIYTNGLLQPIIVRKMTVRGKLKYEILAGHTRVAAYKLIRETLAGMEEFKDQAAEYEKIEALVYEEGALDDARAKEIVIDTNFLQRGDLPLWEKAKCICEKYNALAEQYRYNRDGKGPVYDMIAKQYDIKKTTVFQWLKINELIPELQPLFQQQKIGPKAAYKLACMDVADQKALAERCYDLLNNKTIGFIDRRKSLEDNIQTIFKNSDVEQITFTKKYLSTQIKEGEKTMLIAFDPAMSDKILAFLLDNGAHEIK